MPSRRKYAKFFPKWNTNGAQKGSWKQENVISMSSQLETFGETLYLRQSATGNPGNQLRSSLTSPQK